ncbi:hypothetical protein P280DRAFT_465594 [Massarina eburnea CBS 473.64]|uniref:Uncharacterized protein n=1 Tax=Massarina eburnea CBS 473.64 TaxID=1395130 RepID=A0A6A6SE99_9PLEO|nr:hypothetical protein P280DRAFT_465594 [Massarina eburnea CBS 473.64]
MDVNKKPDPRTDHVPTADPPGEAEPAAVKKVKKPRKPLAEPQDKLRNSPSPNTPFPTGRVNMTMVEIITFLPRSLHSWQIVERFVNNGIPSGTFATLHHIMEEVRESVPSKNSLLKMMQESMRKRKPRQVYKQWTAGKHARPQGWDGISIEVTGFLPPVELNAPKYEDNDNELFVRQRYSRVHWQDGPRPEYAFKDFLKEVKLIPTGPDMLDLTRCILYHRDHPDENWTYPEMYHELLARIGGPAPITEEHQDRYAFLWWNQHREPISSFSIGWATTTTTNGQSLGQEVSASAQINVAASSLLSNQATETAEWEYLDDKSSRTEWTLPQPVGSVVSTQPARAKDAVPALYFAKQEPLQTAPWPQRMSPPAQYELHPSTYTLEHLRAITHPYHTTPKLSDFIPASTLPPSDLAPHSLPDMANTRIKHNSEAVTMVISNRSHKKYSLAHPSKPSVSNAPQPRALALNNVSDHTERLSSTERVVSAEENEAKVEDDGKKTSTKIVGAPTSGLDGVATKVQPAIPMPVRQTHEHTGNSVAASTPTPNGGRDDGDDDDQNDKYDREQARRDSDGWRKRGLAAFYLDDLEATLKKPKL